MKDIWNAAQLAITAIGGWLGWVLGGLDGFLYALVAFVVTDYLTGLMAAGLLLELWAASSLPALAFIAQATAVTTMASAVGTRKHAIINTSNLFGATLKNRTPQVVLRPAYP